VWTRACTVSADLWMNCLLQPGYSQTCGRMPLWIRSTRKVSQALIAGRYGIFTMACKITASCEAFTTSVAGKCFLTSISGSRPFLFAWLILDLSALDKIVRNVAVLQHWEWLLHLRWRRVVHAIRYVRHYVHGLRRA